MVAAELDGRTVDVGTAYFTQRRNLTTSFRYHEDYLSRRDSYAVEPGLELFAGVHRSNRLPGAFADCSPDRWGKHLIAKKVQAEALQERRNPPTLNDIDFLIGVSDCTRQGALRFRSSNDGPFLAPDLRVPKMVELPRLLRAADVATRGDDDMAAIKALLDAGSGSLGGARPKASVSDGDQLHIAKFAHQNDEWDVIAWEKTALDLAHRAGIDVPRNELVEIDGRSVLILNRFDKTGSHRTGYISAMTLVEGNDGDTLDYTEVAETLTECGSRTSNDLRQLWRRIAYSIAIHNTDDHLRNHGFLRDERAGWRLSPAFDINPNPDVTSERVTGIGGARTQADELVGLMTYAETFDLTQSQAKTVLGEVSDAVRGWRTLATLNGISKSEQQRFEAAFDDRRLAIHEHATADVTRSTGQPRDTNGRFAPKRSTRE